MKDTRPIEIVVDRDEDRIIFGLRAYLIKLPNISSNKIVNELFFLVQELASLISNLIDVFI